MYIYETKDKQISNLGCRPRGGGFVIRMGIVTKLKVTFGHEYTSIGTLLRLEHQLVYITYKIISLYK